MRKHVRSYSFILLCFGFIFFAAAAGSVSAQENGSGASGEDKRGIGFSVSVKSGFSLYMPFATAAFDRSLWDVEASAALLLSRFFILEAGYRYGGIIYGGSGYASYHGAVAGIKVFFTKRRHLWSDGLYMRLGTFLFWPENFRNTPLWGGYIHPGYRIYLASFLYIEQELTFRFAFGVHEAFVAGVTGGVTFTF